MIRERVVRARRSLVRQRAWSSLSPNNRRILLSHRPDDFERDMALSHSIVTALENVFGPREWRADAARLEEGEEDERRWPKESEYAMTLGEIGDELGVSRERVRCIIASAFSKLRRDVKLFAELGT